MKKPASIPEDILTKIQAGDADAMAVVVAMRWSFLVIFADRITHDHHLSEDVAQDALMQLWLKSSRIQTPDHLNAWLYITTRNIAFDRIRPVASRREIPDGWLLDTKVLYPHDDQTASIQRMEWTALIAHLPEKQQACARLRSDGFSHAEIATTLDIPEGTVRRRMHDARLKAVRLAIAEGWEEKVG